MHTGQIFNIQRYSLHDGPGIRTTVFLKGCPLACWWCHNPEGLSPKPEILRIETRCRQCGECRRVCPRDGHEEATPCQRCGACVVACPSAARQWTGRTMTVAQVMEEVLKDRLFYDQSGGGVTFSGGEPLWQAAFLHSLLKACRAEGLSTVVETSGFTPSADLLGIAPWVDLFLYDLKILDDARHRQYTGVSNVTILANLHALVAARANLWLRVPLVPGLNDAAEDLGSIARLAASLTGLRQVSLLPYHATGAAKFARLGKVYRLPEVTSPSAAHLARAVERFRAFGLNTVIGS